LESMLQLVLLCATAAALVPTAQADNSESDTECLLQAKAVIDDADPSYIPGEIHNAGKSLSTVVGESVAPGAWDSVNFLGADSSHACSYKLAKDVNVLGGGTFFGGGSAPTMCLREYPDAVSDSIHESGVWPDCPELAAMWTTVPNRSRQFASNGASPTKHFVDIGANIGACLLPMMARPDVKHAFAFEPNPANLFYLTSSVRANPEIMKKLTLYPVALGEVEKVSSLVTEESNAGNTIVGIQQGINPEGALKIQIRRLDDILAKTVPAPYIHLMKLDAQGYEVKILRGAHKLFSSGAVNAVKFELAGAWLKAQNTSSAEYCNTFMNYGYQIYNPDDMKLLSQSDLHANACGTDSVEDFLALRVDADQEMVQKQITCEQ